MARNKYDADFDFEEVPSHSPSAPSASSSEREMEEERLRRLLQVLEEVKNQEEEVQRLLQSHEEATKRLQSLVVDAERIKQSLKVDTDGVLEEIKNKINVELRDVIRTRVRGVEPLLLDAIKNAVEGEVNRFSKRITDVTKESIADAQVDLDKAVKKSTEKMKEVTGEGYLSIPTGTVYRFLLYFIALAFFSGWAGKERLSQIIGENGDAMFLLIGGCAGLLYQILKNVWDWVKENLAILKGKKKGFY